ncbi:hypothetical protein FIBSPDRAFT_226256 [Athelia psychrophila]|uniref:Uncharacterized protein n=1 Tax=Athelia psychrophila TaxID=1759441 RepID=A0A165YXN0_9AGAM|nr:hypothetical protein FIBSPDRAFT_223384 [Fibularhizoctonia sp. CBS 109695]KZP29166.1 hypothetical protein FIBSPDRAFT_226256 [Fibularhizoctonia sp. CBS 109695]
MLVRRHAVRGSCTVGLMDLWVGGTWRQSTGGGRMLAYLRWHSYQDSRAPSPPARPSLQPTHPPIHQLAPSSENHQLLDLHMPVPKSAAPIATAAMALPRPPFKVMISSPRGHGVVCWDVSEVASVDVPAGGRCDVSSTWAVGW